MSDAPAATEADKLAPPPPKPPRSNSSASNRSNTSSRRGHRSPGSSASVSRSNSHSSQGNGSTAPRKGGNTTTISGGTSLGGGAKTGGEHKRTRTKGGAVDAGSRSLSRRSSTKQGPQRPTSAAADKSPADKPERAATPSDQPKVRSLHAATSPPIDAMEAAVTAATKKHHETHGQDALSSLQRMISDLKAISPSNSNPGSRQVSGKMSESPQSPASGSAAPVAIPGATSPTATTSTKLKADAPSFTPGSLRTGQSPTAPTSQPPPPQARSAGGNTNRRGQSQSVSYGFSQSFAGPAGFPGGGLPHFPLADVQPGQSVDFSQFSQHAEVFQQQQQLLAAQQLQLQLLQAQLVQQQMASQQQQRDTGFIAPRFQALAAQRAALQQQQQQQQAQMAEAQRLFELQQQQMLLAQQQPIPETAPVFEEDSPEHSPVGPTGRPQLNPNFTFGKRRESQSDKPPVVVDRSAGVGGAAATGLAGLAARAHKRSGSDMAQQDPEQLEIQRQIEALQAKQKELMTRGGSISKPNLEALKGQATARHRRTQSQMSSTSPTAELQFMLSPGEEGDKLGRSLQEVQSALPSASSLPHNRRHSMNVLAKGAGTGMGFGDYVEDGGSISIPPGGFQHHRSGSRGGFESGNWRVNGGGGGHNATADLASAQAQLASLAQFRAAAGSGHAKMASFSFPNMLPNLLAATTLQNPAGQSSLWQQQQAFQMQLQQNQQGPQRKSLFAPYLPQASLPPLLSAGKLVVGILRVNKKNRSDAYVATDVLDADIYICGSKDRNRALEGDIVAVELLDVDEVWGTKKDKEEKKRKKEENYDVKPSTAKKLEKKKDDIEVEGQSLTLFEDEEVNDETKPTYAGHVVAVVERMPGQLFSGQLGVLRPSSAATKEKQEAERREREGDKPRDEKKEPEPRPKIVWFKPTDKRVPLIAIPTEQAPPDFIENPEAHANKLFVATIKRWPITSLHPFGTLVEELGPIGDSEVETSAILKDCNFPTEEFSDVALKCLPPLPWTIPEREFETRVDLREDCVFTIDPTNSRDLDDALSITANDDSTHTVGVHIADVSYFLKANTALDRDARKRAASVYLVQRAVPMLPPLLSEQLCSLIPDSERLAFSAFFVIDKDGNAVEKSYRRSIIKSSARLSYADAAGVIAGGKLDSSKVTGKHSADKVAESIRLLHDIAGKLRNKRIENGAMLSARARLTFALDESGEPVDVSVQEKNDANMLLEEFTVLTNTSIAAVIANGLSEQALLRRQEAPNDRRLAAFVERAKGLGFDLDPTNAGTLQKSFNKITDKEAVFCLSLLEKKTMQPARYFCTGMLDIAKYSHWALNAPLYTHFTSPIRRYADVLVHRMLDACLSSPSPNDVKFLMDRDQVAKCAQQCNMKRQSARLAEDQSAHLHLCILVSNLSAKYGPVVRHARVTGVYDQAFDVVIPEFSLEKRVHLDKLPLETSVFDEHTNLLSLYWKTQDVLSFLTQSADDEHLLKIKQHTDGRASGASTTRTTDASALLDDSNLSSQVQKSTSRAPLEFEGLRKTDAGHRIQDIKEFSSLPVIVTADMSKSPPVLVVYACNPYAA
ncbi:RNB-domain-containing protein [Cutaneotrichosporon oleaginosum]|uniref:DIS3-like exonuclease 2 n=1 Tax=Cutaneotrichosporon oleaginosum TaxID=879819 RepID=A0A0J0XWB3_9TREE|nr:RNB-domain-containing protein [Cutaneotrichosporon oleaginosum]KLT45377.1 RNB-domain-containing protein [Cutaneotrichosporon oleaginosum]